VVTEAIIVVVVLVAGAVTGVAGFGFALIGTMVLADVLGPSAAVAFMILPILAANVSLVRELDRDAVVVCGRRFGPFVAAAFLGTLAGMALLGVLPDEPMTVLLGVLTLGFVAVSQNAVEVPLLGRAKEGCFVESNAGMVGIGGASGVLFGATNIGVQVIAYLRSCDLPQKVFVGVVGLVFVGINAVRVGAAGALGLYPEGVLVLSAAATVPAVAGVWVGKRLRPRIDERHQRRFVLGLLTVIGLRLVTSVV
jgi:Sulfite exporter TauE/SafE.